jgi:hypothetical protein
MIAPLLHGGVLEVLADHRFRLIRIKVERAKKHIDDLEDAIRDVRKPIGKTINFNKDTQTSNVGLNWVDLYVYSSDIPAITGDVVHNLRSALDHLAWQLVEVGTLKGFTRRSTLRDGDISFPIAKSPEAYKSMKPGCIEGAEWVSIEAIDELNPYRGGNDALWMLRQLDNTDKHSYIVTAGNNFIIDGMSLQTDETFFTALDVDDNKQDVNISVNESDIKMKVRDRDALLPTIHQLADFVDGIVTSFASHLNDGTPQARTSKRDIVQDLKTLYGDDSF